MDVALNGDNLGHLRESGEVPSCTTGVGEYTWVHAPGQVCNTSILVSIFREKRVLTGGAGVRPSRLLELPHKMCCD